MDDFKRLVILNIKKYRKQFHLSQAALAEELGVSLEMIGKIESGKQFPSHKILVKMTDFFGIAPYELFLENETMLFEKEQYIKAVMPLINKQVQNILLKTNITPK